MSGENNFEEGETHEVHLREDDPDTFNTLISWLYRGVIPNAVQYEQKTDMNRAYILADKLCMNLLKNTLADSTRLQYATSNTSVRTDHLLTWRDSCVADLPLKRFFAKHWAWSVVNHPVHYGREASSKNCSMSKFFREGGDYAWQVLRELIQTLAEKASDPSKMPGCVFHDHDKDEVCHLKL